ncbi:hypothetical protein R1sor_000031 [Riccia sorocarpa]|uniref:Uncharacterized protein n=1 Tax=Riccia sorocarpa TaxID=122646 RepID=A0ABD3GY14_9MARC
MAGAHLFTHSPLVPSVHTVQYFILTRRCVGGVWASASQQQQQAATDESRRKEEKSSRTSWKPGAVPTSRRQHTTRGANPTHPRSLGLPPTLSFSTVQKKGSIYRSRFSFIEMQPTAKLREPLRDTQHSGPQRFHSGNLAVLQRSNSSYHASGSKLSLVSDKDNKGKAAPSLVRGASFRRQGSSGMTWMDNWTFTDDGMFSRNIKVSDEKTAKAAKASKASKASASRSGQDVKGVGNETTSANPLELQRSLSVGSGTHSKHHKWGIKWIKKNLRKAFR